MKNIFISYANKDRDIINKLEPELRKHGVIGDEPFTLIDPLKNIKFGENVRDKLFNEMQSASMVVFLDTDNVETSPWVYYEAGIAHALNKPVMIFGKKGMGKTSFLNSLFSTSSIEMGKPD